jgi:hypothetical protein
MEQGLPLTINPEMDRDEAILARRLVYRRATDPALVCEILGISELPPLPGPEPGPRMADLPRRAKKASGRHG